jgi:hypothetical protein
MKSIEYQRSSKPCSLAATLNYTTFMFKQNIETYFNDFDTLRLTKVDTTQNNHRYNSFDFCFNYFSSFADKAQIANDENIETSCLQLGFYLASWGMLRGSSELLEKSLGFYIPMVRTIADFDNTIWAIDVDKYDDEYTRKALKDTYEQLSKHIPNQSKLTLATKIMLGVFGNVPAFDRYFKLAMRELTGAECGFTAFNDKSLLTIYKFYKSNKKAIDTLAAKTRTNVFGYGKSLQGRHIPKAKVIDIIGFQYGLKMPEYEREALHRDS